MVHTNVVTPRPDVDIQAEIERRMLNYPPLAKDRHSIEVRVQDGTVIVTGNVQTPNTHRWFVNRIPTVDGVTGVDAAGLYDDESIRLEAGRLLPDGINVGRCQYGNLILVGRLPDGISEADAVASVRDIAGVRQVITDFR